MAKGHKPLAGSRGYWPRKRSRRVYRSLKSVPESSKAKPLGFAGYKGGMTQAIIVDTKKKSATEGQEVTRSVTVLDAPNLFVCGLKTCRKTQDGLKAITTYWSEKAPKDLARKTKTPKKPKPFDAVTEGVDDIRLVACTDPRTSGMKKKRPELFEIPLGGKVSEKLAYAKEKLGKELKASDIFEEGESIDVLSVSKGKGVQGPVKRFGIKVRPRKHEKKRRHVGVIGPRNVARVLPGKIAMAGQMGYQNRTEYNKKILKIGEGGLDIKGGWLGYGVIKHSYIVLEGSVPGPKKRLIMLRKPTRPKAKDTVQVKEMLLHSHQGV